MNITMMSPTKRDGKLVADLPAQRSSLRKSQMMDIRGSPTANQARLLGHIFNMFPVANPTCLRQRQYALVDNSGSSLFFPRRVGTCEGALLSAGPRDHPQHRPQRLLALFEKLLNSCGVGCRQGVFTAKNSMSPIRGVVGRVNLSVRPQVVRAKQPMVQIEDWLGGTEIALAPRPVRKR